MEKAKQEFQDHGLSKKYTLKNIYFIVVLHSPTRCTNYKEVYVVEIIVLITINLPNDLLSIGFYFSGEYVTVRQRDVCKDGFGLENIADAVFLDLPNPADALPYAKTALKKTGKIFIFRTGLTSKQSAHTFIEACTLSLCPWLRYMVKTLICNDITGAGGEC